MNTVTKTSIHPLVAAAAVALIIFSGLGAASILGWLPQTSASHPTEQNAAAVVDKALLSHNNLPENSAQPTETQEAPLPTVAATDTTKVEAPIRDTAPAVSKPASKTQSKPRHTAPVHHPEAVASHDTYNNDPREDVPPQAQPVPVCGNCGVIANVRRVQRQTGEANGVGAVGGAVLGGILGNQVGGGRGRDVATVLGALGGGLAGHNVEKRVRTETVYEIQVRLDDGSSRTFTQREQPGWQSGQRIQIVNDGIAPL